jgi:hypothetical protein
VDGNGVIVGIIDDGCALAHRNFLVPAQQSRAFNISGTDHGPTRRADGRRRWTPAAIRISWARADQRRNQRRHQATRVRHDDVIEEDRIYEYLNYPMGLASHGTHVMDIAAAMAGR